MDTSKPNIIFLISDAISAKEMSIYSDVEENNFNLKKIAEDSVVFEKNFSTSNATEPSVNSMFLSKYPCSNGLIHQHPFTEKEELEKLRKNKFWFPLFIQSKGYQTISTTPLHSWFKKGFGDYQKREIIGGGNILQSRVIKKILLKIPNWAYRLGKKISQTRASPIFHSAKEVINVSIKKIEEIKKPFFLFMHLTDTHYPYPSIGKQRINGKTKLKDILKKLSSSSQKEYVKKRFLDLKGGSLEEIKYRKWLAIKEVDEEIGRLYEFLKQKDIWENTIFIFLSDHGDNFGEHSVYFCRGGLYDSSIHVPLIIHIPKIPSQRINELTQSIDIIPTIIELLGEEIKGLDGKSLMSLIQQKKPIRKKIVSFDGFSKSRIAVRSKEKKKIFSKNTKCYLCGADHGEEKEEFNLIEDPKEEENLAKA